MYFECSGPFLRCCLNFRFPTCIGDTPENADIERLPQVLGPNSTHRGFRLNTLGVFFLNIFPTPTRRWSLNHHLGSMKPGIDAEKDGYDTLNAELSSSKFFVFQQGNAFKKQKYKITPPQSTSQLSEKLLPTPWKNHPNFPFPSTAEVFFNSISNPHPVTHSLLLLRCGHFWCLHHLLISSGPVKIQLETTWWPLQFDRQKKSLRKAIFRKNDFLGGQKKNWIKMSGFRKTLQNCRLSMFQFFFLWDSVEKKAEFRAFYGWNSCDLHKECFHQFSEAIYFWSFGSQKGVLPIATS